MRSITITTVLWLLSLLLVVAVASHNDPNVSLVHSATTRNSSSRRYLLLRRNQRRRRNKEDDKKSEKNAPTPTVAPTAEQRKSDIAKATKEQKENTESPVAAPKESSFSDAVFEVATDAENENDDATDDGTDVVVSSEQEQEEAAKRNNNKEAKATPSPTIPELPRQANPVAQPISLPPFFAGLPFPPAAPVPVAVAPAPVPVVVPTPIVVPVPVVVPTTLPVAIPTPIPIVVPTTMAPVSETTPAPQIVNVTMSPTTMMDSESPSSVPSAMPIVTTDAPVTEPPSDAPSQAPIVAASEIPSVVPSTVPSLTPTVAYTVVNITLQGVFEIQYPNVSSTELSTNETGVLETITENWFQNYYNNVTAGMKLDLMLIDVTKSTVRKFRKMQVTENTTVATTTNTTTSTNSTTGTRTIQVFIEDMVTNITINSQMITPSSVLSNPTYKNVVQYQQQLQYRYFLVNDEKNSNAADGRAGTDDDHDDHDHDNSTASDKSMDNIMAQVLAVQPFLPVESSKEYQMLVSTNIVPFASVGDIGPPVFTADDVVPTAAPVLVTVPVPVPVPVPTPAAPTIAEDKSLSSAAIAGISVGGLIFFGLLLYGLVILPYDYKRATTANAAPVADMDQNDMGDGDAAMVAANTTPVKDNSTSRKLAQEQETAAMMNKSIITKQQSYGAEETSTLGGFSANQDDIPDDGASYEGKSIDTTEFDYAKVAGAGVIGGAATAAALSTTGDSDIPGDDNQFVIYAPAGKLGLVVDNPDDGAPVVHAIKEDSVLIGQVHVGDRLIGVDEVDVRTLSPVKVSKLISKRSSNPLRKLTLVRGKPDYDEYDTGTDGGDTASHTVDTASHFPEEEVAASSESLGIPPNPSPMNDDETSHVESMSRLSGDEDNDDDDEEEKEEDDDEEEEVEEESVMDYPDDTSSVVDAMSHTSGLSGIPPVTVDETKTDDGTALATTQVGEATSEQATSQ